MRCTNKLADSKMSATLEIKSDAYPVFETIKPFCTCGNELSSIFYEITASESFDKFMTPLLVKNNLNLDQ